MIKYFLEELPSLIPDFEERPEQLAMAKAIKQAVDNEENLIIEAGTGVGKTLAYLIPLADYSIKNKKRVIICTYSKALQTQIFEQDMPLVKKMFPDIKYEAMFGSENYICMRKHRKLKDKSNLFKNAADVDQIIDFIAAGGGLRENSSFELPKETWDEIKREKASCLEEDCKHFSKCHYWSVRRRMFKANFVIINHHLFFADAMVNRKLLPQASVVVFDEAHRLEDTMRMMCSKKFDTFDFVKLLHDIDNFFKGRKKENREPKFRVKAEITAAKEQLQEFSNMVSDKTRLNSSGSALAAPGSFSGSIDLVNLLKDTRYYLKERVSEAESKDEKKFASLLAEKLEESAGNMESWIAGDDRGYFYWVENYKGKNMVFYITPYDLKKDFEQHIRINFDTAILTSATLSIGEDFSYVKKQFGLDDAASNALNSPFDYRKNSLIYLEREMAAPQSGEFGGQLVKKCAEIIRAAGGGIFILFTSFDLMKKTYAALAPEFPGIAMMMQGEASPSKLIEKFKRESSVLFATNTFWQGIDIKGDALKCVVITRLPFEVPDHPLQKAVYSHVVSEGGNDFAEIALPRAIFMLKQGFGRLIRSKEDYGVVAILDSRVMHKSYGRLFINALPETTITHTMKDVEEFFISKSKT
jgi:ATP-dependent DNA helicase DinG